MNERNTTVVPTPPQDSLIADAVICGVLTGMLYVLVALSGCGVSAGPVTIGTTGFQTEVNKGKIALERGRSLLAARQEVQ